MNKHAAGTVVLSFRASPELVRSLDLRARGHEQSRSKLILEILEEDVRLWEGRKERKRCRRKRESVMVTIDNAYVGALWDCLTSSQQDNIREEWGGADSQLLGVPLRRHRR